MWLSAGRVVQAEQLASQHGGSEVTGGARSEVREEVKPELLDPMSRSKNCGNLLIEQTFPSRPHLPHPHLWVVGQEGTGSHGKPGSKVMDVV